MIARLPPSQQDIRARLERGELVRLLKEVDSGQIASQDFEAAYAAFNHKHWLHRVVAFLLDRW